MRILVCGSRHFDDFNQLNQLLADLDFRGTVGEPRIKTIIEGEAKGADTLARKWGEMNGKEILKFPADWDKHGRAAGPIRNNQMLDEGKPDLVVAFLAKDSKGTKNMIEQAEKAGVPVKVINI